MNDYERIARVIRFLDDHRQEQPDLATLARCVGLSPYHFHRLFSNWAGITPKDFLQCLTHAHAKQLLHEGENVLEVALQSGLSGPGRLHDLFVQLEAASPGEVKSGGTGWTICFGFAASPFGQCLIAESPRGICHVAFVESEAEKAAVTQLKAEWPQAGWRRDDANAARISVQMFAGPPPGPLPPGLRAYVRGTAFQVRVWRALMAVPSGLLTSYGRLAESIGQPAAARSVGTAVGQNPLAYLIPCHRVIRETGVFGHYRWGPVRKRALVTWETSRRLRA